MKSAAPISSGGLSRPGWAVAPAAPCGSLPPRSGVGVFGGVCDMSSPFHSARGLPLALLPESFKDVLRKGGGRAPDHTLDGFVKHIGRQAEVTRQGGTGNLRSDPLASQ